MVGYLYVLELLGFFYQLTSAHALCYVSGILTLADNLYDVSSAVSHELRVCESLLCRVYRASVCRYEHLAAEVVHLFYEVFLSLYCVRADRCFCRSAVDKRHIKAEILPMLAVRLCMCCGGASRLIHEALQVNYSGAALCRKCESRQTCLLAYVSVVIESHDRIFCRVGDTCQSLFCEVASVLEVFKPESEACSTLSLSDSDGDYRFFYRFFLDACVKHNVLSRVFRLCPVCYRL